MKVLVDTSVWVEYLRGGSRAIQLDAILTEGFPATNELILAELIPALRLKRHKRLITLLQEQNIFHLKPVWPEIMDMQTLCLQKGINRVGLPDLLIAQNAMQNKIPVYSLDRHFEVFRNLFDLRTYFDQTY